MRLDQDILSPLAGKKQLYTYETLDFWEQIKTPGYAKPPMRLSKHFLSWGQLCDSFDLIHCRMSLKCSALYLYQFRYTSPHLLASGDGTKSATIIGDVFVHPSAKIHPSAKVILFPFVSDYNLNLIVGCEFVFVIIM